MDVHVSLYALTVSTRRFVVIRGVEIPVARFYTVGLSYRLKMWSEC
ncbi:MAG: hypothetical protein MJ001_03855 [Paludibacteraceae bacterium]|nr:hypothetical protein [Paludibacteraceae bacterium]